MDQDLVLSHEERVKISNLKIVRELVPFLGGRNLLHFGDG